MAFDTTAFVSLSTAWFLARLQERSTYIGVATFLGAVGFTVPNETVNAIATVGVALAGVALAATDRKSVV